MVAGTHSHIRDGNADCHGSASSRTAEALITQVIMTGRCSYLEAKRQAVL